MTKNPKTLGGLFFLFFAIILTGLGCNSSGTKTEVMPANNNATDSGSIIATPTSLSTPVSEMPASPSLTNEPSQITSQTPTPTSTSLPTTTPPQTPTQTPLPTITPTYAVLRGTVLEQANCRYGSGAAYLYKYGLYAGYNLEIIGRNELGTWIVVQAIGGTNPCWVKASLMDIKGDVMSLAPTTLPLPESPYYGPVTGAWAVRNGNSVIISWDPITLRAGDDSLQYPYLVEAWLCQDGQLIFTPIGSWETILTVQDEPGCSEASHARVYGVEKHGYTAWVTVPWPSP